MPALITASLNTNSSGLESISVRPVFCTVKLSRKLFSEHHRHSLDTLVGRYDIVVADRHRAWPMRKYSGNSGSAGTR